MTNADVRDLVEKYRILTDEAWEAYADSRENEHSRLMAQAFAVLDLMPADIRKAAQHAHDLWFVACEDKLVGMTAATVKMREARAEAANAIVEDLLKTCGVER